MAGEGWARVGRGGMGADAAGNGGGRMLKQMVRVGGGAAHLDPLGGRGY